MRKCQGLIDSLVRYVSGCVEAEEPDDKVNKRGQKYIYIYISVYVSVCVCFFDFHLDFHTDFFLNLPHPCVEHEQKK